MPPVLFTTVLFVITNVDWLAFPLLKIAPEEALSAWLLVNKELVIIISFSFEPLSPQNNPPPNEVATL